MSKGMLIGYSKGGLPLYSFSGPGGGLPQSPAAVFKQYLRQILDASDSRNIFFYLCLNLVSLQEVFYFYFSPASLLRYYCVSMMLTFSQMYEAKFFIFSRLSPNTC